ncbi:TPA: pilus assembly protein [Aeromonas hydrophila]|uniref:pilus assembly PilX family protein n=1 Tax=Aeromonas hydrophila TaxID=644 RepID=UPI0021E75695|nr:pilus assembly protein [Aeromonas hydrophila]MCV3292982.1 pilus assembly protein [Aeromonas hydrophila]
MMARQGGMALVISLIFLAVVSLLAMASMQSALLQEKMAGNQKESQQALQALQAAEAALRAAERYLEAGSSGPYDNSAGLYEFVSVAVDPTSPSTAWRTYANSGLTGRAPEYFIERLPYTQGSNESLAVDEPISERRLYRITARGFGLSDESRVLLQSTYSR